MPRKKQGPSLEDHTRVKIAKYLPDAIDYALQSYRGFYHQFQPIEAKDFSAHHTACKAAIAHIELLLKLAEWAELPRGDDTQDTALAGLMADAQAELDSYQEDGNA
ncbi:MAG TPA: hypothetical protein VIN59_07420 [Alphaproteobacteria bacterium]